MRRYLTCFAATAALGLLATLCLALVFEPFVPLTGDLTRIGHYAEKDFGWTAPQPVVQVAANGKAVRAPAILVLGDSFSRGNLWQSVTAVRTGKSTQSFEFARIGCIRNWLAYAYAQPEVDTIVIESVERSFLANFKNLPACTASTPVPFETTPGATSAQRASWPPEWHIQRTFRLSYQTLRMQTHPGATLRGEQVNNAPLEGNCARFSNRRADRLLYFAQDEEKFRWNRADIERAIANVLSIQQEAARHGKRFILVLAPDKLSAYGRCLAPGAAPAGRDPELTAALIAAGVHAPDLLGAFRENVGKITDLYLPDDTHPGEAGYILMGERIARFLNGS